MVKLNKIPASAEELYAIAREGSKHAHVFANMKWEDLPIDMKEYWRHLFNKLYIVPKLPQAGTVVRIGVGNGKFLTGVVIIGGPDGRVIAHDPDSLSEKGTFYIHDIKSIAVADDPFRYTRTLW